MDAEEEHCCYECNKQFIDSNCLKAHVRKIHANKDKLKCECCGYTTNYKDKLKRHAKTHNNIDSSVKNFACPLCTTFQSHDRSVMKHHYSEVHNLSMETKNLEFKNKDDFMAWKGEKEEEEVCRFIAVGGPRKKSKTINQEFRCFRDGFYISRGKGVRHLKIKGSHKIDGICPASMKTSQDVNTSLVRVKYCAAHVGHVAEPGRLNLNKQEKDEIARKIAGKIPFDAILDDIRDSITNNRLERISLTTRKDLWNIEQSYNLSEASGRDIRQRHRKALEMKGCVIIVTKEGWSVVEKGMAVASQSGHGIYNVVRLDAAACDCKLKCDECSICIHSFRCSCVDCTIKSNICKHIHRVCLFLRESGEASSQPLVPDSIVGKVGELDMCVEKGTVPATIVQELTNHELTWSINEGRERICQQFMVALNEANSVTELNIVRHAIGPILPTIIASRSGISCSHTDDAAKKPVNPTA